MPGARKTSGPKAAPPLRVLFVAGFGPISRDIDADRRLFAGTLGIHFEEAPGGYLHTEKLAGVRAFAVWPLSQAAESCFGEPTWPSDVPTPQAWLEFDVEDIRSATAHLKRNGYQLLVSARKEPWGQTVSRFLGPGGLLLAVTHTPWMRSKGR